ncbi:unnamed protein product [Arabis nemorensis]|uniref:Uncharacterized protein n=1 Tax=Arabis nemorensis TaxID=586526 RepID=A0A565B2S0_9BRAS|nr:unnamed protein product [Arabis nemorensis]
MEIESITQDTQATVKLGLNPKNSDVNHSEQASGSANVVSPTIAAEVTNSPDMDNGSIPDPPKGVTPLTRGHNKDCL